MIEPTNVVLLGFLASGVASLGTALGALGVYFIRKLSQRVEDGLLSFAAGIMLAASFFSLLLPAIDFGEVIYGGTTAGVSVAAVGVFAGAGMLWIIHSFSPHEHFVTGREGPTGAAFDRIWLFVIAITIHNFPEGMAVGVGFAGGDVANGIPLTAGIGIQNLPEGLAVSVSLMAAGYSKSKSVFVGILTGLVEPIGGLFGAGAVSIAAPLMPFVLAFSAGAMLFIISDEIIPETHRNGFETLATFSLLVGFVAMMFLDATLA